MFVAAWRGMRLGAVVALLLSGPAPGAADAAEPAPAGPEPGVPPAELARRIREDRDLTEVLARARRLVQAGLNAGDGYGEVWIRDLNTFIELALDGGDPGRIREALLNFFRFQGDGGDIVDGYIPAARASVGYQYRRSALAPGLLAHKNTVETDQESSLVLAVGKYLAATGDRAFLGEVIGGLGVRDRLGRALEYVYAERFDRDHGLVWGATTVDWGDVQPEHEWGVELDSASHRAIDVYDNAMYVAAIRAYLGLEDRPEAGEARERWATRAAAIREAARRHLWDAGRGKFRPHVYLSGSPFPASWDESAVWYHGGTAVAIEAGFLEPGEIRASLAAMRDNVRKAGAASIGLTVYPPYPDGLFKNRSMGAWSYQNGGDWCWFGGRMVQQLIRHGLVEEAYAELRPMVTRVIRHGGFYEWWTRDNQPKGSGQFRGSAGVLGGAIVLLQRWAAEPGRPSAADAGPTAGPGAGVPGDGARIYARQCASCHGAMGEGVAGKSEEPLQGDRTVDSLARLIERTMPEDRPGTCVGDDARAVAAYIHGTFYSPEARARRNPVARDFAHLTTRQFRESVADLLGEFGPVHRATRPGGLQAEYYQSKGMNKKDRRAFDRVDPTVDFDFGENGPGGDVAADQFSIAWSGSLLATETGVHEFRLTTPNGARVYLNTETLEGDANRRDDSDARRQPALIDLWVSSGNEPREGLARLFLLGGRSYPLRVDFFKFKDRRAAVRLEWKPPAGAWSVIPADHLSTERSSRVWVVGTPFPPDDGSRGYERGTAVSKAWSEAVTKAAVETANLVVGRLGGLTGAGPGASNRVERWQEFCGTLAERAFRRPLTPELRRDYVEDSFAGEVPPETAVKRAVIRVVSSPRFLYPDLGGVVDDAAVAARLALVLWDSVPDEALRAAVAKGELRTAEAVRGQARRMLEDPRARAKLRAFFRHWLRMDEAADITKDAKAYPGFDEAVVADLRVSLERFVEDTVWSEASDFRQLLLADHLLLNPRLARFYGAPVPAGEGFVRTPLDPAQRAGILTHPFLLATFSYHRSSSPIHRGVFLTRNVLGRTLRPPPMAIEFMDDRFDPALTMREKVTQLTAKEACMGCHATINPLGFSLEHFDAVGRYRTEDNLKPVDSEAEYRTSEGEVLRLRGPRDVAEHAVSSPEARAGFVRQLFLDAVKQPPAAFGPETLPRLDAAFVASGHHMRELLVEIATVAASHGIGESSPAVGGAPPPASSPPRESSEPHEKS